MGTAQSGTLHSAAFKMHRSPSLSHRSLLICWALTTVHSANHFVMQDGKIVQKEDAANDLDALESFHTEYDALDGIKNRAKLPEFPEPPVAIIFKNYGSIDKALDYLKRVTREDPDNVNHFNDLGNVWRVKGHTTLAVDCFRKCLSLDPRNTDALLNLAVVLINTGYPQDAERLLRTALEMVPLSVLHHFTLGNALVARGLPDAAAKSFRRALALQPDFVLAQNRLIELIALGWLPPVENIHNSSTPALPGVEHARELSKSSIPVDPVHLVKTPKDHLDANRGFVRSNTRSWTEKLESSIASHWLPIVTTIALVLTVMVMIAPLLENAPEPPEQNTAAPKSPPSSPKLKGSKGRGRK